MKTLMLLLILTSATGCGLIWGPNCCGWIPEQAAPVFVNPESPNYYMQERERLRAIREKRERQQMQRKIDDLWFRSLNR